MITRGLSEEPGHYEGDENDATLTMILSDLKQL